MIERAELPVQRNNTLNGWSMATQAQQLEAVWGIETACGSQQTFAFATRAPRSTLLP